MVADWLVVAASFVMVIAFALLLGAQMFDAAVNQPVFFADPPNSVAKFLEYPIARRIPAYFIRLIVPTIGATGFALIVWLVRAGPTPLIVAVGCAVVYIAMIFLFFVPTNRKLGFLPAGPDAPAPAAETIRRLVRYWRVLDRVRMVLQFAGLVAAVLAVASALP